MKKSRNTTQTCRSGSTLTEVLIAMVVLGIGAVSVMTLFPVATSRAIKSNQLTQSTVLRYTAETAVGALDLGFYELFYGPNREPGDGSGFVIGFEPGPDGRPGQRGVDDDGMNGVDDPGEAGFANTDDFPRFDVNLFNPQRYTRNQFNNMGTAPGTQDDFDSILIDPLGFYRAGGDVDATSIVARTFGTFEPEVTGNSDGERPMVLPRVTGGHRGNNTNTGNDPNGDPWRNRLTQAEARALVTLPDQYSTLIDAHVTAANGYDSVDLNNKVEALVMTELAGFVDSGNLLIVGLVDLDGNVHIRTVNGSAGTPVASVGRTIGFAPPLPDDPANAGNPIPIERAIIQQQNSDFTWMISARVSLPVDVTMDVVVFFKRSYAEADERVFYSQLIIPMPPPANALEIIRNRVRVFYTGDKPFAKKGSYLFDTQNNRWYRILEISAEDETSTPKTMELLLDREVLDDDGSDFITSAFPRGVIDVFPIGKKTSVYNVNP